MPAKTPNAAGLSEPGTRSNGIMIAGDPAANNVIKGNQQIGGSGSIHNEAKAKVAGNKGYG